MRSGSGEGWVGLMPGARRAYFTAVILLSVTCRTRSRAPEFFNSPVPDPFSPDRPANTIARPVSDPPALGN